MHGEVDDHAHVRHARRERTDTGDGDGEELLALDGLLHRLDGGLKRSHGRP